MLNNPPIPIQLLNSLEKMGGINLEAFVDAHAGENKITSIRLNPFKIASTEFELDEPVAWCEGGFYVNTRPSFTYDPLFHAGCYYVQEAGSMFLDHVLRSTLDLNSNLAVLDLCGAPGGKSTLINSLLTPDSLLVANEIIKSRAGILSLNLSKWGTNNCIVTNNDPAKFGTVNGYFDAIVIDAPCSGSGLFRKQPEAINEWSPENVIACSIRQKKIVEEVLPALKENGVLIYSTCSYSVEENEEVVEWMKRELNLELINLVVKPEWNIVKSEAGFRFYPHLTKSEGFFCAVLRKTTGENPNHSTRKKAGTTLSRDEINLVSAFVSPEKGQLVKINNQLHFMNNAAATFMELFDKQFYFKKAGTVTGEIKGSDFVPNQELAWSIFLNESVSRLELTNENALKFLKKETFEVPEGLRGLELFTYKNFGIGWGKVLQNRINNYLPNEIRILK